mgnify:CR=1 FL=1
MLGLVGGGKSKGKGFRGKGSWQWNKGGGGWSDSKGGKGKGKATKGSKGGSKGGEKGKGAFQGNCHNRGNYGHRAADCPEPRHQNGVKYVSDYYQPHNPLVFMVTNLEDSHVDYRHPWKSVGNSNVQKSVVNPSIPETHGDSNRFKWLMEHKDGDVEINIGAACDKEFPIQVPDEDLPKRSRMPRLPPRVTQSSKKSKFKLGCDGDAMSMKHFSGMVSAYANCGDKVGSCIQYFI